LVCYVYFCWLEKESILGEGIVLKKLYRILCLIIAAVLMISAVAGCGSKSATKQATSKKEPPVKLTVSAAASLKKSMTEIQSLYAKKNPNVTLTISFSGSGALEQQIEQGAPVDVFFSASAKNMDTLANKGLLQANTRKDLLSNKLVLIVPNDSTATISFKTLASAKKIAIGDPASVPCGTYAQQVFKSLGITNQLKGKLVLGKDVTEVLNYVESGGVDAGVVYLSEAKTSTKVKVVETADQSLYSKPIYPVAVIKASKNLQAAEDFVTFLASDQAKGVYQKNYLILLGK
jgi:molybdate transport system substrate-binding protein